MSGGLFTIDLDNDAFGHGAMAQAFANATGTAECGSKPTCISFGKNSNCAEKNRVYNECRMKALEVKNNAAGAMVMTNRSVEQPPPAVNPMLLIGVAIVVIVIIVFLKIPKKA